MRHLKTTWRHIRRSPYQAFAAVFIMAQTFFVLTFFAFFIFTSSRIIAYFESVPQVTAFFKDEAKQEDIDSLRQKLEDTDKIAKIEFSSKLDAFEKYKELFKDDPLSLELVNADILPSSFGVSTNKIEDLSYVADMLSKSAVVERVVFQQDLVKNLSIWTNALRKIGIVLSIILALDAMFLMIIIIGIKISQKKEEIEIVRLIGATSWYVRWPFIYEGIFYGIVGAFFGWLLGVGLFWYATPFLESFLKGIPLFPIPAVFFAQLLGVEFLIAIFLGIFSSFLAVLRYLK
ncbi:MAG: ABC transporter permease [Candidatus Levybacteria bacterium]|nr:ABC transporter permease [Candidatus Levybacteria bacterium]